LSRVNAGPGSIASKPQDRLVLSSSMSKAAFLLFGALAFVGLGFLLGTGTMGFSGWIAVPAKIVGWFTLAFFGLAVIVALFRFANKAVLPPAHPGRLPDIWHPEVAAHPVV
jgi:energy-coupling factor transporter transmembrane protein EcfT